MPGVLKVEVNSRQTQRGCQSQQASRCSSQLLRVHELSVFNLSAALLTAVRGETGSPRLEQFTRLIGWRACNTVQSLVGGQGGMSQHSLVLAKKTKWSPEH